MRLLRQAEDGTFCHTADFRDFELPEYAILSHRWGRSEDEVTYEDIVDRTGMNKTGYQKLRFCAQQAAKDGLHHIWIDTCSINRPNYTELTEALTSMFKWYRNASKCYVYLHDVPPPETRTAAGPVLEGIQKSCFRASSWFQRGWTLQELLAPRVVEFYSREGFLLGDKITLENEIHGITGLPLDALRGRPMSSYSIPERMSWAANRETGREEDAAYCLFGIFDLFMVPFYGEGKDAALKRLKRELTLRSLGCQIDEIPQRLTLEVQEDERRTLLAKLSSTDPQTSHARFISKTVAGTGAWFLNGIFREWLDDDDRVRILWLHGKSGSGKSTLLSNAFEGCKRSLSQSNDTAIGIHYCAFDNNTSLDPTAVLGSYATQLLSVSPDLYRKHVTQLRDKSPATASEFIDLLKELCTGFKTVLLFLDAVNESPNQYEIVDVVKELLKSVKNVSFCLSSTRTTEAYMDWGTMPLRMVEIDQDGQKQDIDRYVAARCANSPTLAALSQELQQSIRQKLQHDADGMWVSRLWRPSSALTHSRFRYVQCQCDLLAAQRTGQAVRKHLDKLAQSLGEVYLAILERISVSDAPYARETLMWLSLSPLTLEQLSDALALEEGSSKIDPERRLQPPEVIFDICQSLIAYDSRSHEVSIAHSSVLTFLKSDILLKSKANYFHFSMVEQNTTLLRKSLAYFLLDPLNEGYCLNHDQMKQRSRTLPLLECATVWPLLVRRLEESGSQPDAAALQQMQTLFSTSRQPFRGNFGAWLSTIWINPKYDAHAYRVTQPLYAAAACGMASVVHNILQNDPQVNIDALGGRYDSPALQVAVYRQHCRVVELLLQRGANPNISDSDGVHTLRWAYMRGCPGCIEALIRFGARLRGYKNEKYLQLVSKWSDEDLVDQEQTQGGSRGRQPAQHLPAQAIAHKGKHPRELALGDFEM